LYSIFLWSLGGYCTLRGLARLCQGLRISNHILCTEMQMSCSAWVKIKFRVVSVVETIRYYLALLGVSRMRPVKREPDPDDDVIL